MDIQSDYSVRRERIRHMADRLLDTMETLEPPQSHLEAERAAKALHACDRLMQALYEPAQSTPKAEKAGREEFEMDPRPTGDALRFSIYNRLRRHAKIYREQNGLPPLEPDDPNELIFGFKPETGP